jgi:hypothetical protein
VAGAGRILVSLLPQFCIAIGVKLTASIPAVSLQISLAKKKTYGFALVSIA